MKNKISTLYITGDSFSQIIPDDVNDQVWPIQLARIINAKLQNTSCYGVSQDWNWSILEDWSDKITSDDQLIVVLTDPGRFWFIEDKPELSNSWIVESEFEKLIGNIEIKKAIEYYIQYIQRPKIDCRFLMCRLGWLNNLVRINNWKKPLILLAFDQFIPNLQHYPDLTIVPGNLMHVSHAETDINDPIDYKFVDTRHNHFTLSNHTILATKIGKFLTTGEEIDLKSGFIKNVYTQTAINNPDFVKNELSLANFERYKLYKSTQPGDHISIMNRIRAIRRK